jgi:transposase
MTKVLENMGFEELLQVSKKLLSENLNLESRVADLQFQVDQMNRLLHGSKRERFVKDPDENQMTLPFEIEPEPEPEKQQETITYVRNKTKRTNHPGRMTLPSHLPVKEVVIEPEEDTTGMKCIGKEITEQLDFTPAKLSVIRYIRPKYIKLEDDETLTHKGVIGKLPVFPIEKCMASPAMLAQIHVDKFVYHLPLNRQNERFSREGIRMPSSTLNGWQDGIYNLLWPLYESLKRRILAQGYLQVDETPIQVLDKTKKGKPTGGITGFIIPRWKNQFYLIIKLAGQGKVPCYCLKILKVTFKLMVMLSIIL